MSTLGFSSTPNKIISNAKTLTIMDYAIYKTLDGKFPHVVHRFSQDACNHRAKRAAQTKLGDMWLRLLQHPALAKNATATKDEFSYDHAVDAFYFERIRFYIAPIK